MVIGTVQNKDKIKGADGKPKLDADGNVIAAISWDEQDADDELYEWILAVESEHDEQNPWEPLDARQICLEMEQSRHPFVDQRDRVELLESDEEYESSGPPGLQSSDDEGVVATQAAARDSESRHATQKQTLFTSASLRFPTARSRAVLHVWRSVRVGGAATGRGA